MMSSKGMATLLGPTLIAITITEAINLPIWAMSIPAVVYLNGTLLFVAGAFYRPGTRDQIENRLRGAFNKCDGPQFFS